MSSNNKLTRSNHTATAASSNGSGTTAAKKTTNPSRKTSDRRTGGDTADPMTEVTTASSSREVAHKERDKSQINDKVTIKANGVTYIITGSIGNGSFGVVFLATVAGTGEDVAIKKVLQDKRFKNRELQIMKMLDHCNVVALRNSFYTSGEKPEEVYLNLVLEYVPDTVYRVARYYNKLKQPMPLLYVKLYIYQLCRALAYIHSLGICHRDIKPQNLLLDPQSGVLKLCDFGSAKILVPGEPNVSYICSRYYRAPELIFGSTNYTTAIDVWSMGCVLVELLLGTPLFPGESGVDQLVEIIKVLGTPSREQILAMNPNYTEFKFPPITPHPWSKVFRNRPVSGEVIDLISHILVYNPSSRISPLECCAHTFFDELRDPNTRLPNGRKLPPLYNFSAAELANAPRSLVRQLIPPHALAEYQLQLATNAPAATTTTGATAAAATASAAPAPQSMPPSTPGGAAATVTAAPTGTSTTTAAPPGSGPRER